MPSRSPSRPRSEAVDSGLPGHRAGVAASKAAMWCTVELAVSAINGHSSTRPEADSGPPRTARQVSRSERAMSDVKVNGRYRPFAAETSANRLNCQSSAGAGPWWPRCQRRRRAPSWLLRRASADKHSRLTQTAIHLPSSLSPPTRRANRTEASPRPSDRSRASPSAGS
jgi:hypothetical protein